MENVLHKFYEYLQIRLDQDVYCTEDSIRYTFFAALLQMTDLKPHEVILEYPHNEIFRAMIDTYIPNYMNNEVAIEFKYDREIPSGKNAPRPQKAGKLFNDLFRLAKFQMPQGSKRIFIYLTDYEMASYLKSARNRLDDFFNLRINENIHIDQSYLQNKSDTFRKATGDFIDIIVYSWFSKSLPRQHQLKIYIVKPKISD